MTFRSLCGTALLLGSTLAFAAPSGEPQSPQGTPVVSQDSAGESKAPRQYSWQRFEMDIPAGWTKELDSDEKDAHFLRLVSMVARPKIVLLLTFTPSAPAPDSKYLEVPGLAGLAMAYPAASKAAGATGKGTLSFNEVQLGNGPAAAAQVTLPASDGKSFVSAHGFTRMSEGTMLGGFILTSGKIDSVNEEPAYHKAIAEAYAMLRTLQVRQK